MMPPVLLFSSSDWDGKWGSRQQVALELAKLGHDVLFVERFAGLEHWVRYSGLRERRRKNKVGRLRQVEGLTLWKVAPPLLLPGAYYSTGIAQQNAKRALGQLSHAIQKFLAGRRPILWLFKPEHHFLVGQLDELVSVYHCIDEFTVGTTGRKKQVIQGLERALLQKVDVAFANSILTYENKKSVQPNCFRVPSGANIGHFGNTQSADRHLKLRDLQRPILIFAGQINEKIDVTGLSQLAEARLDWTLVLLGKVWPTATAQAIAKLESLPNVLLAGPQPFEDLPSWFAAADLCILPYAQGEATRYRSPLKLYEYMATGLPIVSTHHPEVAEFSGLVHIAPLADWEKTIESALEVDSPEQKRKRLDEAQNHSWEKRVNFMLSKIEAFTHERAI